MKKALFLLAFAGASLFAAQGCKNNTKDDPEPQPLHDVDLKFNLEDIRMLIINNTNSSISPDTLNKYTKNSSVRYIYLVPENNGYDFRGCTSQAITKIKTSIESIMITEPNKIMGKGNFQFNLGSPSKVPEDSLWFVEHGWKINNYINAQQ